MPSRVGTRRSCSVPRGDATLTINGRQIPVYPTGGWLAWLALPDDSLARFHLIAATGSDTAAASLVTPIAGWNVTPASPVWINTAGLAPVGDHWVRPGEGYVLSVPATPGSTVRALFPDGDTLGLESYSSAAAPPWGQEAFSTDAIGGPSSISRYLAWRVGPFGPDPGPVTAPDSLPQDEDGWVQVEAFLGSDTARAGWPLRVGVVDGLVPPLVVVDDDTARSGTTDKVLPGRTVPFGTYHWFFPNGTLMSVSGRANSQIRLQLSRGSVAWVDVTDVVPVAAGTPLPLGVARSMRLTSGARSVTLRIPMPRKAPFRVYESERRVTIRLYGMAADMDWVQYSGTDPLVRLISFDQLAEDEVEIAVDLDEAVWGYRTTWSGADLLLEIRRPPEIDAARPLRGRRIAVDAGHPPGGATGPTGVAEAVVTLGVARELRDLLEERGASVLMTRDSDSSLGLIERTAAAELADAEILVSIHANALPDGVNPFTNSGTSVYYYHPRSIELARRVDRALVRRLGFRDLGVGRGDLHLVRPTWMPAILVEGLFMMIPDQEAVLASDEGQRSYARGVLQGIEEFLRWRAERRRTQN